MENELEDENEDRDICVKCKRVWEHCYCGQKEEIEEIEDRAQLLVEKIKRHVDAVKVGSFGEMYPLIRLYAEEAFSSRDTYWKERVRKEVEGMKVEVREHYDDCDVQTGKSQRGECRCGLWRNHHRSRNQALDTLLDNLK